MALKRYIQRVLSNIDRSPPLHLTNTKRSTFQSAILSIGTAPARGAKDVMLITATASFPTYKFSCAKLTDGNGIET